MGSSEGACEKPFVGLRPFETPESLLFFGRQRQVVELLERLHDTHLVGVVGSSGSGKSSLIKAGLIPALRAGFLVGDRDRWMLCTTTPGESPMERLSRALVGALEPIGLEEDETRLRRLVESSGVSGLMETVRPLLDAAGANLLVVVDQFEEIFRRDEEPHGSPLREEDADYVSILLALARQRAGAVFVVLTMRSDHLGDCDVFPGLPESMNESQFLVPRLSLDEVRVAIEGPVRLFGRSVAPRLVDRLINDSTGHRDQLPLLQHVLLRMWDLVTAQGREAMDLEHYEHPRVGTLRHALNRDADEALEGLGPDDVRSCRLIFQALTRTDVAQRRVRRWQRLGDLVELTGRPPDEVRRLVDRFRSDGRSFLRYSGDPSDPATLVDISHESLIRQWVQLGEWVDEEDRNRQTYSGLCTSAARWRDGAGNTLRDPELALALLWWEQVRPTATWAKRYGGHYAAVDEFLTASERDRTRELQKERERQRLKVRAAVMTRFLLVVSVVAVIALVAAGAFLLERWKAESATHASLSSVALVQDDPEEALRQAIRAMDRGHTPSARRALRDALAQAVVRHLWDVPLPFLTAASFSPDGGRLAAATAAGSKVGRAAVWDAQTGRLLSTVCGVDASALQWLPDGHRLILGLSEGRVVVWDPTPPRLEAGDLPILVENIDSGISEMALRPDGRELAVVDSGAELLRFDISTEDAVRAVPKPPLSPDIVSPEYAIWSVAFSPDGARLAVGDSLGRVTFVETGSSRPICQTSATGVGVLRVAYSGPGLGLIGVSTNDYLVNLWADGQCDSWRASSFLYGGVARDLAFTHEGSYVVTVSDDGSMKLWDPESGEQLFAREAPRYQMSRVSVSPRGLGSSDDPGRVALLTVATTSDRTQSRLMAWDLSPRPERDALFELQEGSADGGHARDTDLLELARRRALDPPPPGVAAPSCPGDED